MGVEGKSQNPKNNPAPLSYTVDGVLLGDEKGLLGINLTFLRSPLHLLIFPITPTVNILDRKNITHLSIYFGQRESEKRGVQNDGWNTQSGLRRSFLSQLPPSIVNDSRKKQGVGRRPRTVRNNVN